jgi:hypothetical protein
MVYGWVSGLYQSPEIVYKTVSFVNMLFQIIIISLFYSFIHICTYSFVISPYSPLPPPGAHPPSSLPSRSFSALFSNFVEEKT